MAFIRMGGGSESGSKVTIIYDVDGTTYTEEYSKGDNILLPSSFVPQKEDYTFYGWSLTDGGERLEEATAEQNTRLYALFLANVTNFAYNGGGQTFFAKKGVTYLLDVYGSAGGYCSPNSGGAGGRSYGYYKALQDEPLYVYCGGITYNGGGSGGYYGNKYNASGGGATHISKINALLSSLSSNKSDIIIVAGGGGGAGWASNATGGSGGGINGGAGAGPNSEYYAGWGGSQTSGNDFGQGGSGNGGAGGGGYYGGTASQNYCGGGGGSGYIGGVEYGATINGANDGNGKVTITISSVE